MRTIPAILPVSGASQFVFGCRTRPVCAATLCVAMPIEFPVADRLISNRKTKGIALMSNNKATRSKVLLGFFFVVLLTSLGFYGCGSDSSPTQDSSPTAAAAIPVSLSVTDTPIPVPVIPPSTAITAIAPANAIPNQVTISSPNTLASGDRVTISGSTNYNGTFTAISTTPQSFDIAAPYVGPVVQSVTTVPVVVQPPIPAPVPVTAIAPSTTTPSQVTISSPNTLANGDSVIISGSTNYNGTYTAISPTPASFDIAAPYVGPVVQSVTTLPVVVQPPIPAPVQVAAIAPATITPDLVTISSPNTLANGAMVAISGSTNYNGTYTAISPTPSSFTIAAPFVGPVVASGTTPPVVQPQILATPVTGIAPSTTTGQVTVVANNTLTSGTPIVISGSSIASLNGPATVIAPTPTSFSITTPYVPPALPPAGTSTTLPAGTTLGVVFVGGGLIPGCTTTTTGAAGAITLPSMNNVPSRFTGVAPLAVFFDATGTTATTTTRPFHDLEYRWDYGDVAGSPVSGTTWSTGSRPGSSSRNTATGPVAAHVFERPGTYIVKLAVVDGTNTVSNSCVQIAVQDPDVVFAGTNTICFSTSGTFTPGAPCPVGATQVRTSDLKTAMAYAATNKRLLFRRGETWTSAAAQASVTATGPGIVGAYGSGALPKFQPTVNTGEAVIYFSSSTTPNFSDWRLMDFEIDGSLLTPASNTTAGIASFGGAKQITMLRLNIHDVHGGGFSTPLLDVWNNDANSARHGHTIFDQMAIVDSSLTHSVGGNGANAIYMEASRLSFLGNLVDDTLLTEHSIRIAYANKAVYSNNTLSRAAAAKHLIKQHAGPFGGTGLTGGPYSQNIFISDNRFVGGVEDWSVAIGPEDKFSDERIRDVIVERNWFTAGSGVQVSLMIFAAEVTVRNNICDMTGAAFHQCVHIGKRGIEPASNQVRIYNNTWYSNSTGDFQGVGLEAAVSNITVQNNLASAPLATSPIMFANACGGCLTQSNNSSNSQAKNTSPLFTDTATFPAGAKPTAGSYAIGGGVAVPVWSDFFLATEPASRDIGAVNH